MNTNHKEDNEHNNNIENVLWESNNAACGVHTSMGDKKERKSRDTDKVPGNRQAMGLDPAGDCVAVTEGILELCDLVRAMCNDVQQCFKDLNPDHIEHSVKTREKVENLDHIDLQQSVDIREKMANLDPSDLQHMVDTSEKVGNLNHIDLKHSADTGEKVKNQDQIDLQHLVDIREKIGNPDTINLQHSVNTSEMVRNLDFIELKHLADIGEKMGNTDPIDLQHLMDTSKKVGNLDHMDINHSVDTGDKIGDLDPSDIHHSQQHVSALEEEPRHPNTEDFFNEWIEFIAKDENQQKEYREQVLRDLSDAIIPIAKSVLRLYIEEPKCTNSSNRQPSDLEAMGNKAKHSELNFGVIALALLDPFKSFAETENESKDTAETAVKEKSAESTETDKNWWITWIDGIYELVELYCDIKSSDKDRTEDNDTKGARTAKRDRNTNCKKATSKSPVTIWADVARYLITDLVESCLWIYGGCQDVAADSSYEADDVLFCCDGSCSIDYFIRALNKFPDSAGEIITHSVFDFLYKVVTLSLVLSYILQPGHSSNINTESNIKAESNHKAESNLKRERNIKTGSNIKAESNIKTESNIKAESNIKTGSNIKVESNIKTESENKLPSDLFQFLNWLNENSNYFTNIECPDTDAILPNIVKWLSNWAYSITMPSDQDDQAVLFVLLKYLFIGAMPLLVHVVPITRLKYMGVIFPYLEYFVRKVMGILFSWILCFCSKNLSFTEKNPMFGRRCLKQVSFHGLLLVVLSVLCIEEEPSEFTELVEKLYDDFQIENISSRLKPKLFHYEQHHMSLLTKISTLNADVECKSVVDMLWLRYQDTLSQSNWCNAATEMRNMFGMFIDDLREFAFPEIAELPEGIQMFIGIFSPVLSGSRLDGCVSLWSGPGNESDFDVMATMIRSNNFIMECVPDRPTSVVFKTVPYVTSSDIISKNKDYLRPLYIKNRVSDMSSTFSMMLILFPFHRILNIAYSIQSGNVADTFMLFRGKDVILSIDFVPAVIIDSWPKQAQNWIHRNHDWPILEMRESISRGGCHAVAKTPKGGDPEKEWRLSFSKAENTLCKVLTPSQLFHLSLLKTQFKSLKSKIGSYKVRIFKNYTITKGVFHSYHAKTAMFWFCENHPPEDKIWRKENVYRCQSKLLESMEGMMREGYIPHYFIPEQNLLEDISAELLQQAVGELHRLKEEARTENGRVYQEIIKQPPHEDQFLGLLKQIMSMILKTLECNYHEPQLATHQVYSCLI